MFFSCGITSSVNMDLSREYKFMGKYNPEIIFYIILDSSVQLNMDPANTCVIYGNSKKESV